MNELSSMLVPLETLPSWPKVDDPSALHVLALLVGAPLLVIAIVAVISRIHHAVKGNTGVPAVANQPIWVNGRRIEPATQDDASRAAIEGGHEVVAARAARSEDRGSDAAGSVKSSTSGDDVGGAGARW